MQSVAEVHVKDKKNLASRQWKEEWNLVQDQHGDLLTLHLNIIDQSLKINLRTLETLYQKYLQ